MVSQIFEAYLLSDGYQHTIISIHQLSEGQRMSLTATQVKNLKPKDHPFKIADSGGLYLLVNPTGSRLWRMNYRHLGRQRTASFGRYPDVTLAEARERRDEAKRSLRAGQDPVEQAQSVKRAAKAALAAQEDVITPTFESLSLAYQAKRTRENASRKTLEKYDWLHRLATSEIGHMDPMEIEPPHLRPLLLRLEVEGKLDSAARVRTYIGQVMRYGIAAGLAVRDPSPDLRGLVASPTAKSHAAIVDQRAFGKFLRDCDSYTGHPVTVICMQLVPLIILRSSEIREGTWDEVDFEKRLWRVPRARMKGSHPGDQIVPLSDQAYALLRKLHAITGRRRNMFETLNSPGVPLAENTVNQAYRRMGYLKNQVTMHGLRTTFSTIANEELDGEGRRAFEVDWIERQLAHVDHSVRGVYNAAEYLSSRTAMMQWWADKCDEMAERSLIDVIKVPAGGWQRAG